jgi:hypothetical protein
LDLPPTATSPTANVAEPEADAAAKSTPLFSPNSSDVPVAPKGPKKPFILDPLLGN